MAENLIRNPKVNMSVPERYKDGWRTTVRMADHFDIRWIEGPDSSKGFLVQPETRVSEGWGNNYQIQGPKDATIDVIFGQTVNIGRESIGKIIRFEADVACETNNGRAFVVLGVEREGHFRHERPIAWGYPIPGYLFDEREYKTLVVETVAMHDWATGIIRIWNEERDDVSLFIEEVRMTIREPNEPVPEPNPEPGTCLFTSEEIISMIKLHDHNAQERWKLFWSRLSEFAQDMLDEYS